MPADEASQTSCYVLVDGRKVMEMQDADAAPRHWEWLRRRPREKSDMVERTAACPRQTKCLIAVEAGQYFEIYVGHARSDDISTRVYVDGALVSKKMIDRPSTPTGKACCGISSSSYDDDARRTGYKQKMRFAPIAARDPDAPAVVDFGAVDASATSVEQVASDAQKPGNLKAPVTPKVGTIPASPVDQVKAVKPSAPPAAPRVAPKVTAETIASRVTAMREAAWRTALIQAVEGDPDIAAAFDAILRDTWQVNRAFLSKFGKDELKFIAQECGLVDHMGAKAFAKLLEAKTDKIVDGMLNATGFSWAGRLPSAITLDATMVTRYAAHGVSRPRATRAHATYTRSAEAAGMAARSTPSAQARRARAASVCPEPTAATASGFATRANSRFATSGARASEAAKANLTASSAAAQSSRATLTSARPADARITV